MAGEISLSLNGDLSVLATGAGGVAVNDSFSLTLLSDGTALKAQGSSDGGSTYSDIAGTAVAGNGTTDLISVTLMRCPFDHIRAVFSGGTNPKCFVVRTNNRQAPKVGLDRTKNKTIVGPALGTA